MTIKAFYNSPQLVASIDAQTVLASASGFVSTISCWEEPTTTCDFQQ